MLSPWVRLAAALFAVSWGANQFAPMQLVYREHLGLGNGSFTAMLASYVVGLVPALLYFGRVSDRFGRRAVILPMIPVGIVSSLVLIAGAAVPDLLYLGRVLAGLASGMAFGAGTAWMKELSSTAPSGAGARRAAVSLSAGFGCGALFAGVIAQWLPAPELLPYLVHIALMLGALALVWAVPDVRVRATDLTAKPLSVLATPQFRWGIAPWAPWVFGVATVSFATLPPLVSESLRSTSVAFTGLVAAASPRFDHRVAHGWITAPVIRVSAALTARGHQRLTARPCRTGGRPHRKQRRPRPVLPEAAPRAQEAETEHEPEDQVPDQRQRDRRRRERKHVVLSVWRQGDRSDEPGPHREHREGDEREEDDAA